MLGCHLDFLRHFVFFFALINFIFSFMIPLNSIASGMVFSYNWSPTSRSYFVKCTQNAKKEVFRVFVFITICAEN
jgi:hypothetical protein